MKRSIFIYLVILAVLFSCKEEDLLPPILEISGNDTIWVVLNSSYTDPGATATDDVEGNISSSIYVNSNVNSNITGTYQVEYNVTDQSGNEAEPQFRTVIVYNEVEEYNGIYVIAAQQIYPEMFNFIDTCYFAFDTVLNNRINISNYCLNTCFEVYADINDTLFIIPFQSWLLEENLWTMQATGHLTDTIIYNSVKIDHGAITELWEVEIKSASK